MIRNGCAVTDYADPDSTAPVLRCHQADARVIGLVIAVIHPIVATCLMSETTSDWRFYVVQV